MVQNIVRELLRMDSAGGVAMLTRACPDGLTPLDYAFAEGAHPDIRLLVLDTLRARA